MAEFRKTSEAGVAWLSDKLKMLATLVSATACFLFAAVVLLAILFVAMIVVAVLYPSCRPWLATHLYVPVIFVGGYITSTQYYAILRWLIGKKGGFSPIPCVGGVLLAIGLLLQPVVWLRYFAWLGLFIDYSWPCLFYLLIVRWDDFKKQPEEGEAGEEISDMSEPQT